MYCPRCGAQNTETTKFCRQCGLALAQISNYVATGGTGPLPQTPAQPPVYAAPPFQFTETAEMMALRHKRTMTVLAMLIAPVVLTIIGEEVFNAGEVMAILFLMIPLGVMWAVSRYRVQLRQLQEQQLQQHYAPPQHHHQPPPQPTFQARDRQPALSPPPTNPLNVANPAHGSVTEEETQRFPGQRG